MKAEGSENVQPAELVKPKGSCCSHGQLCPGILVKHLSSLLTSTLQGNIPVNCDYSAASYCMYAS